MAPEKKGQSLWGLIVIAAILSGLSYWTYQEVASDYMSVERSNRMVAALLENQTQVVRTYSAQLNEYKKNLAETQQQLAKVQADNTQLQDKLASLANVTALEERVAELEAANSQLKQDIALAVTDARLREEEVNRKLQEYMAEMDFKTIQEGRTILAKYKKKIREIKSRIKGFQVEDRNELIASKKAQDAARLSLGNQGYLIRNGAQSEVNVAWPPAKRDTKNVQIDVTFVK